MDKEEFDAMEVKPLNHGWYFVTLYQFQKDKPTDLKNYIQDWLEFNGNNWNYSRYSGYCYVCFIHSKIEDINK